MQATVQLPFHQVVPMEVARLLQTDLATGLSAPAAGVRLKKYGPNQLSQKPPPAWWKKLLRQFGDLIIWILLAATALSLIMGDWLEAAAILIIVILNAVLGFLQEQKAERALFSLKKLSARTATVIRDGKQETVVAEDLVPGDLVEIEAGNHIPADLRLIRTFRLTTQEAALTGESLPVSKDASFLAPEDGEIADRCNMAYLGTTAVAGKAVALVTATGMHTELGRIAGFLQAEKLESTPLEKRLAELGRVLVLACLSLVAIIFAVQLVRGEHLAQTFLLAISLAVAAVPEGLPAVVTVSLALGLQRMVRRKALIRRLASVETLGCVTAICSDKTGTLTRNEMTVTEIITGSAHYYIEGAGYKPEGKIFRLDPEDDKPSHSQHVDATGEPELALALTIGRWCNNARLHCTAPDNRWTIFGDPTEGALLVAAAKANIDQRGAGLSIVHEIPFDSQRKLMSVITEDCGGKRSLYTKGAPESVLARCRFDRCGKNNRPLSPERRDEILKQSHGMAERALRVLAVAFKELPAGEITENEHDLVFAGLFGMIDPPREQVRNAVAKCKSAGIRPILITGDHPATAVAIARELAIIDANDRALTGSEIDRLADEELADTVQHVSVYARVSPEHKLRIVSLLKAQSEVVAMTGDGVNDAPAVRMADIGISMGITGTDVTKDASDMVLLDDNFASIINAVEEGRGIYDNIQKFVHYLLAGNASEIGLVLFAALAGWPVPLLPIQLLWINLITDGLPALALAMEKPEPNVMDRAPRSPNEAFFDRSRGRQIIVHGALMAVVAIAGFGYGHFTYGGARAQTIAFYVITFAQLFFSLACRSQRYTLPQLGFFTNHYLLGAVILSGLLQVALLWFPLTQHVFAASTPALGLDWLLILGLALIPVSAAEIAKIIRTAQASDNPQPGQSC